ncbi:MAG: hypothetical protein KCHDKBKB_00619 [Elusimicrobia bacterium]|nr:hypothetical protein [Elusimicrobiota bacterium]
MKRAFPYITTGKILDILKAEGIPITRVTFYKLEKKGLFASVKSAGGWRVYPPSDAALVIQLVKENYGLSPTVINKKMLEEE